MPDIDKQDRFLILQYQTLRSEIEHTKDRIFKILSAEIVIITIILPVARAIALSFDELDTILLAVPLIVVLYALLFISETRALMRAGRYIRQEIEEKYFKFQGWEQWIEDRKVSRDENRYRRSHDVILYWSFIFLCFLAYIFSVWYAYAIFIKSIESPVFEGLAISFYAIVGCAALVWAWAILYSQISTRGNSESLE